MSLENLSLLLLATPGVTFALLSLIWLLGGHVSEHSIARLTKVVYTFLAVITAIIFWKMWQGDLHSVRTSVGAHWFKVAHYEFPLTILLDRLSLPIVGITVILAGVLARLHGGFTGFAARRLGDRWHHQCAADRFFPIPA
jgi:hypothetical protein